MISTALRRLRWFRVGDPSFGIEYAKLIPTGIKQYEHRAEVVAFDLQAFSMREPMFHVLAVSCNSRRLEAVH